MQDFLTKSILENPIADCLWFILVITRRIFHFHRENLVALQAPFGIVALKRQRFSVGTPVSLCIVAAEGELADVFQSRCDGGLHLLFAAQARIVGEGVGALAPDKSGEECQQWSGLDRDEQGLSDKWCAGFFE